MTVYVLLPAGFVDSLLEIAVLVKKTAGDEVESHVAGRLQVIARQYSQSARIYGENSTVPLELPYCQCRLICLAAKAALVFKHGPLAELAYKSLGC